MALLNRTFGRAQSKAQSSVSTGSILLVAGVAIVIIALLQVVQTSDATTSNFAIQALEQEKLELDTSVRELEAQVASLSSLGRIESEARRLGLGPPASRAAVEVHVPLPEDLAGRLPTRFLPDEDAAPAPGAEDRAWWDDVLRLLPFY